MRILLVEDDPMIGEAFTLKLALGGLLILSGVLVLAWP